MHRSLAFVLVALVVFVFAGQALAFQCPKLIGQINAATANRYDPGASEAKAKAAEADVLHKAGKHAEAVQAANEGLAKLK